MNIYIDNLSRDVTGSDLRELFEPFGKVETANVAEDRHGRRSRGFGFVRMPCRNEAVFAVAGVNGMNVKGQAITADEVRPREPASGVCRTHCSCWNRK